MKWRKIKELNGLYKVSETGLIKKTKTNKIMTPKLNYKGYQKIVFMIKGKKYIFRVHRLVAGAFISNPDNKPQVNHKDGNKANNCVDNLEWVTNQENYEHAVKNNLVGFGKNAKPIIELKNGKEIARYESIKQASKLTGVPIQSIYYHINYCKHKHKKTTAIRWAYL